MPPSPAGPVASELLLEHAVDAADEMMSAVTAPHENRRLGKRMVATLVWNFQGATSCYVRLPMFAQMLAQMFASRRFGPAPKLNHGQVALQGNPQLAPQVNRG